MSELEPTRTYSNHTATDVLRRLLDERGVEHYDGTERTLWGYEQTGEDTGIYRFAVSEISGGFLQFDMFRITPEQAIAATLGTGTCRIKPWKMERDTGFYDCMECSECGYVTDVSEWAKATYCAGCGRRVEQ